jgi:hypothetical protein
MAKSNAEIAAEVRAGGNMPGGKVFDPRASTEEQVRPLTSAESKEIEDADKAAAKLENKVAVFTTGDVVTAPEPNVKP